MKEYEHALVYSFGCSDGGSSQLEHETKEIQHTEALREIGSTMDSRWSEVIPPQEFLDEFLSVSNEGMPPFDGSSKGTLKLAITGRAKKEGFKKGHVEIKRYTPLIEAVKKYCPSICLENTGHQCEQIMWNNHSLNISPDIQGYDRNTTLRTIDNTHNAAEFLIEVKAARRQDPFANYKVNNETTPSIDAHPSKDAQKTRDQISTYAGSLLARQHRTHCFSVIIFGDNVRLIRWDRAGATVTDRFHIWETSFLAEFLWRYHSADREARGHDPTAVPLHLPTHRLQISRAKKILGMEDNETVYEFTIKSETDDKEHTFYGGKIVNKALPTPRGRSTRGFLVTTAAAVNSRSPVEKWKDSIHYLKSTWRILAEDLGTEGSVYAALKDAKVPCIPTILASGDAQGLWQATQNDRFRTRRHHNYYAVFEEVGKSLSEMSDLAEFLAAMRDSLKAHKVAYEVAHVLHRDISVGNILIYKGGGLLIDWEFSKFYVPGETQTPRQNERTGTWQFMSARILLMEGEPVRHTLFDDLESFFHVLCWTALQYFESALSSTKVVEFIMDTYDYATCGVEQDSGGTHKKSVMLEKVFSNRVLFTCRPLHRLVRDLEAAFCAWYQNAGRQEGHIDPRSWSKEDVLRWLKEEVLKDVDADSVVKTISSLDLTGESFMLLDQARLESMRILDLELQCSILDAVDILGKAGNGVSESELAKLDDHHWMLEKLEKFAAALPKMPASFNPPANLRPGLAEAVKNTNPENARNDRKRTQSQLQSMNANAAEEPEVNLVPQKKQRTVGKRCLGSVPLRSRDQPGTSQISRGAARPVTLPHLRRSSRNKSRKS